VTTSDVIAALALAVSVMAAIVAGITYYEQYGKGPRLTLELSREMFLSYGEGRRGLAANVAVSLLNSGASDAVAHLYGSMRRTDRTWSASVGFGAFLSSGDAGHPGKESVPWLGFSGFESPIIAPSRKATTLWINLSIDPNTSDTTLTYGTYEFDLDLVLAPKATVGATWKGTFTLTESEADYLLDKCVAVGATAQHAQGVELQRAGAVAAR
jgi:hypothetical protein